MKKFISLIGLVAITIISFFAFSFSGEKAYSLSSVSFYSEKNKPFFYGATEITIDKNVTDDFDIKDSRFRVFAFDYEDGDLTDKISCVFNNVNSKISGNYTVKYSVKDSHSNVTDLTVSVTVTDKENGTINVVRTIYSLPAMENMKFTGTERCNTGDSQILGIYVPQNASFEIKYLNADFNYKITFFTNNRAKNSILTLQKNVTDFQNVKNVAKNGNSYGAVPLITSPRLAEETINKTYKIEIKYDLSCPPLDYYHYKDDENAFRQKWNISKNDFGVVDGEAILYVVPYSDLDKLVGKGKSFETLDENLEYVLNVVNRMDKMIGLSFTPIKATDRNYRTKYTACADAGVNAGAYYAGDFIAVCSESIWPIFQYGWGTLHEIAHGYQGYLGRGNLNGQNLCLNETGNNILAHYVQADKNLYKSSEDWMGGSLSQIENDRNKKRLNGQEIFNNNEGTYTNVQEKLYCLINLFDSFEGEITYGKLFSYFRECAFENGINAFTTADIYAKFFAKEYKANIIPYLNAWKISVSDLTVEEIFSKNLTSFSILADVVNSEKLQEVKRGENLQQLYLPVADSVLEKYEILGDLKITVNIDDFSLLNGKKIAIFKNGKFIDAKKITKSVEFSNLKVGAYLVKLPVDFSYESVFCPVYINQGQNEIVKNYNKTEEKIYHGTKLWIRGIYQTVGYTLTLSNQNKTGKIALGGANLGNQNSEWQARPDDVFISVTILDNENQIISQAVVKGNEYFSSLSVGDYDLNLEYGYKIKVFTHKPQYVNVWSLLSGSDKPISDYNVNSSEINYEVTVDGLKLLNVENFDTERVLKNELKTKLISEIENLKITLTENDFLDKSKKFGQKANIIKNYLNLPDSEKQAYFDLIEKIKLGGKPVFFANKKEIVINKGDNLDLLSLVSVYDNEDYFIELTQNNVVTDFNANVVGEYTVEYSCADSDGNLANEIIKITVKENVKNKNYGEKTKKAVFIVLVIFLIFSLTVSVVIIAKKWRQS